MTGETRCETKIKKTPPYVFGTMLAFMFACCAISNGQYVENVTACMNDVYDDLIEYDDGQKILSCQFYKYKKHVIKDALCMCVMHKRNDEVNYFTYVKYCDKCKNVYDTNHITFTKNDKNNTDNFTNRAEYHIIDTHFDLSTWVELKIYANEYDDAKKTNASMSLQFPTMAFPNSFISDHFFVDCDCNLKISSDMNILNFVSTYDNAKKSQIYDTFIYNKYNKYVIPYSEYQFKYNIVPEHEYDDITYKISCYYDTNTFEDVRYCEYQNYFENMLHVGTRSYKKKLNTNLTHSFLDDRLLKILYTEDEEYLYFGTVNKILYNLRKLFYDHTIVFAIITMFALTTFILLSVCFLYVFSRCFKRLVNCLRSEPNARNTAQTEEQRMTRNHRRIPRSNRCSECLYYAWYSFKLCCKSNSPSNDVNEEETDFSEIELNTVYSDEDDTNMEDKNK
jgi:hypothetical protein